jgi:hypothetical protein
LFSHGFTKQKLSVEEALEEAEKPADQQCSLSELRLKMSALQTEIARREAIAASHREDEANATNLVVATDLAEEHMVVLNDLAHQQLHGAQLMHDDSFGVAGMPDLPGATAHNLASAARVAASVGGSEPNLLLVLQPVGSGVTAASFELQEVSIAQKRGQVSGGGATAALEPIVPKRAAKRLSMHILDTDSDEEKSDDGVAVGPPSAPVRAAAPPKNLRTPNLSLAHANDGVVVLPVSALPSTATATEFSPVRSLPLFPADQTEALKSPPAIPAVQAGRSTQDQMQLAVTAAVLQTLSASNMVLPLPTLSTPAATKATASVNTPSAVLPTPAVVSTARHVSSTAKPPPSGKSVTPHSQGGGKPGYVLKCALPNDRARAAELAKVTLHECGGHRGNGLHLHYKKPTTQLMGRSKAAGYPVWQAWYKCPFCKDIGTGPDKIPGCKWQIQEVIHRPEGGEEHYEWLTQPGVSHSTHDLNRTTSSARMGLAHKAALTPDLCNMQSNIAVDQMKVRSGFDFNERRTEAAKIFMKRQHSRMDAESGGLSSFEQGTWGGLKTLVDRDMGPVVMANPDFNEHSCFVCGDPIINPAGKKPRLAVVYSTVNLLLNAARHSWTQWARPCQFSVDTTYRLVQEGHGLLVVGVMGLDQKLHVIGFAVVSSEDTEGHLHVFRCLSKEVEKIGNEAIALGMRDPNLRV